MLYTKGAVHATHPKEQDLPDGLKKLLSKALCKAVERMAAHMLSRQSGSASQWRYRSYR
jgi:hypothetical protein